MYKDSDISKCCIANKSLPFFVIAAKQCVTFYHPLREHGQIRRICEDDMQDVCTCAEGKKFKCFD